MTDLSGVSPGSIQELINECKHSFNSEKDQYSASKCKVMEALFEYAESSNFLTARAEGDCYQAVRHILDQYKPLESVAFLNLVIKAIEKPGCPSVTSLERKVGVVAKQELVELVNQTTFGFKKLSIAGFALNCDVSSPVLTGSWVAALSTWAIMSVVGIDYSRRSENSFAWMHQFSRGVDSVVDWFMPSTPVALATVL